MKSDPITLLISLGAGIFFGVCRVCSSLVRIPSPAPPLFALLGPFGILVGSSIIPTFQKHFAAAPAHAAKQSAESNGQHAPAVTVRQSGDLSTTPPKPPTGPNPDPPHAYSGPPAWLRLARNVLLVLFGQLVLSPAVFADEPVATTTASPTPSPQVARSYPIIRSEQNWSFLAHPAHRTDPYDGLEYVSLSAAKPDWYASFGAEARETDERIGNDNWSPNPPHNGSFQERYLFVSDLHFGPNLRTCIEFKSDFANGRVGGNRPIDGDDVDFLGLFVEAKAGDSTASPTLRIGREELLLGSGRLLAPREGPNVRQSFTGFRAQNTVGSFALDVLAVHPGVFEAGRFIRETGPASPIIYRSIALGYRF